MIILVGILVNCKIVKVDYSFVLIIGAEKSMKLIKMVRILDLFMLLQENEVEVEIVVDFYEIV